MQAYHDVKIIYFGLTINYLFYRRKLWATD